MLVQCANAAVKETGTPFSKRFQSIKIRRGHDKAIVAICRSMLIAVYHVFFKNESFREPVKSVNISKSE